jgi:hypothetical protein
MVKDRFEGMAFSGNGNMVAIGSQQTYDNSTVCIYQWGGTSWSQVGNDIEVNSQDIDEGILLSLDYDGTSIAIGVAHASMSDTHNPSYGHSGRTDVYKLDWNGHVWSKVGSSIYGENHRDKSGTTVTLSFDGGVVAVGAPLDDGTSVNNTGSVRVYGWDGDTWNKLGDDLPWEWIEEYQPFGVGMSANGKTVAISNSRYINGTSYNYCSFYYVRVFHWNGRFWKRLGGDLGEERILCGLKFRIS